MAERLMTQEEVGDLLEQFQQHLATEQELQEELVALQIEGSVDQVKKAQARHDQIIDEIERLRMEEMLPIVETISEFVSSCQDLQRREADSG